MSSFDIRPIFDGVLLYCEYFRRIVNVANISSRFDLFTAFVLHCKDRIIYSLKTVFIEPKSPPPLHLRIVFILNQNNCATDASLLWKNRNSTRCVSNDITLKKCITNGMTKEYRTIKWFLIVGWFKKTNISINRTNNNHNGEVTERTTASLEHDDNCIDTKGKGGRIRLLVHFQQSNGYWIS